MRRADHHEHHAPVLAVAAAGGAARSDRRRSAANPLLLDHLAHPHASTASKLPQELQTWGGVGAPEVLSVHAEFKRLANESEKRQREEALREEAALEESRNARRSPNRPAGSPPQQSTPTLGASEPAADGGLGASQSMPALQ